MKDETASWSLAELSARTGVPGRTIRFYIARGLVPGPVKAGRSARYPVEALARIQAVQREQARGRTLAEIASDLVAARSGGAAPVVEPEAWWHYRLAEDVTVSVRGDAPPWRMNRLRRQMARWAVELAEGQQNEKEST